MKLVEYLLTLFVLLTLNFVLPRLMPGDPFTNLSAESGQVLIAFSEEQIARYEAYYGLDRPLLVQYVSYLRDLSQGYLGYSLYFGEEVLPLILKRATWTIALVVFSLGIAGFGGVLLGSLSAWSRQSLWDRILYPSFVFISAIPPFLVGIVFLLVLGASLGWFPLSGGSEVFASYGSWTEKVVDRVRHGFLPVLTLASVHIGEYYLLSRNTMITVLSRDFIRTARAKGIGNLGVLVRHGLRNSLIPVVTRMSIGLGTAAGGALVVETVFDYPGIGRLLRDAVLVRDYPVIQGIFLFIAGLVLTMNIGADRVIRWLDPRIC
ncbi:MAG: ABC transporter permease [Spirochaetales bacterium]